MEVKLGVRDMGHFCWICMEDKPNEKFSGKGRRQHICKSCRKKGPEFINELKESQRRAQHYENNVKTGCIYQIGKTEFYLFTYKYQTYAAMGEHLDEVYHYIKKEQTFLYSEQYSNNWDVSGALLIGYYHLLENGLKVYSEDYDEHGEKILTKRQKKYIPVFGVVYRDLYEGSPYFLSGG